MGRLGWPGVLFSLCFGGVHIRSEFVFSPVLLLLHHSRTVIVFRTGFSLFHHPVWASSTASRERASTRKQDWEEVKEQTPKTKRTMWTGANRGNRKRGVCWERRGRPRLIFISFFKPCPSPMAYPHLRTQAQQGSFRPDMWFVGVQVAWDGQADGELRPVFSPLFSSSCFLLSEQFLIRAHSTGSQLGVFWTES